MTRLSILLTGLLALAPLLGLAAQSGPQPASMDELVISSHGDRINGLIYRAAGSGAHPTVLFLHGFPGNERNLDLAQVARRAGYNTLYIDYRGNWGSGGTFTPANALQDVASVLAWARDPANAAKYGIDTNQISLVGHSFGGWLALMTASRDPSLRCVAAIDSWNVGWVGGRYKSHPEEAKVDRDYIASTAVTGGPMRLETNAMMEAMVAHATDWDYLSHAAALKKRPLLLVEATPDTPPDEGVKLHRRLEKAIRASGGTRVEMLVFDDDHSFSTHRMELGHALVGWLRGNCAGRKSRSDSR